MGDKEFYIVGMICSAAMMKTYSYDLRMTIMNNRWYETFQNNTVTYFTSRKSVTPAPTHDTISIARSEKRILSLRGVPGLLSDQGDLDGDTFGM